ncbi:hypothetical protein Bbelb_220370 [Branchiostoma belcheri]|nr:hypothetical protein Bbelb_220370 [Branchiostoma belcheri]
MFRCEISFRPDSGFFPAPCLTQRLFTPAAQQIITGRDAHGEAGNHFSCVQALGDTLVTRICDPFAILTTQEDHTPLTEHFAPCRRFVRSPTVRVAKPQNSRSTVRSPV